MIPALLLTLTLRQAGVRTIELSRGANVPAYGTAKSFGYWDGSDTYIDAASPDDNFAGEPVIAAGPSKVILIRFGDLNRALGPTRHVRKATLHLTIAAGDVPALKSVSRVLVPWNAGPCFTVGALLKRTEAGASDTKATKVKTSAPRWSATWKARFADDGGASWQQPGASGAEDVQAVTEARGTAGDKEVAIDGLAAVVQTMADHPSDNFGLAIQFQNICEFFSSRAAIGHPRLELELDSGSAGTGPDLSVIEIQRISKSGANPAPGGEVIYTAHVKNVGASQAQPFGAQWVLNGRPAEAIDVPDALAPGAETTVSMHKTFRFDQTDHRTQSIELRITPKGPDATPANNALTVYENARQIDVQLPAGLAGNGADNLLGSASAEDWVQAQVRIFNEAYAGQSRFSFAPDGALERVSVQHIVIGGAAPQDGAKADGVVVVPDGERDWMGADPAVLRAIGLAIGLPDYTSMSFPEGKRIQLKIEGSLVDRGTTDLYPGVIGYGDTRDESGLAGAVQLPYEPYPAANTGFLPMRPTGLLCATDVAELNDKLGRADDPPAMPKTTLIKATDLAGHPLRSTQLDFFQSKNGAIPNGPAVFSVTTSGEEGTAILPNRGGFGPYGKLEADGGNGTFLIRCTAFGVTEWGWLKAWQLEDTASRGNTLAGVIEVRFDLPSAPLDSGIDLAKDRIVTDSTNLLPAKIGALVAGGTATEVTLGGKPGDWVEVDLGKDRTIGEIDLCGDSGEFWPKFDIQVYETGQSVSDAVNWSSEQDWDWTAANRHDPVSGDPATFSVAYRAPAVRIRFIRIVNRSPKVGKLRAIRVVPVKIGT